MIVIETAIVTGRKTTTGILKGDVAIRQVEGEKVAIVKIVKDLRATAETAGGIEEEKATTAKTGIETTIGN